MMRKKTVLLAWVLVSMILTSCEKEVCKQCIEVEDRTFGEAISTRFCEGEEETPDIEALNKLEQVFKNQKLPVNRFQKCNN